mmetsp:Transcript_33208/g.65933  ORF Transcript_33208/g.65933 Transcript_33208/m.65933 type:complete len:102 (+) Transcript_33208:341-646(+)
METPVRSNTRSEFCKSSQEALLAQKKNPLDVSDDCPICRDDFGILCRVGCHPSTVSAAVARTQKMVCKGAHLLAIAEKHAMPLVGLRKCDIWDPALRAEGY